MPQFEADLYEKLQLEYMKQYRAPEVSMDEVAGLVGAYGIAFRLVKNSTTRTRIKRQVNKLGRYLAENGFLLIRPGGGFTARGATGALPAYEHPLVSAFHDITKRDFSSRTDFMVALEKAGYARVLEAPMLALEIGGLAAFLTGLAPAAVAGVLGFVQSAAALFGIPLTGPLVVGGVALMDAIAAIATIVGPINLSRAIAIFANTDCFDLEDEAAASEVGLALLLKAVNPRDRVGLLFRGISLGASKYAVYHLPPLALSAVDGTDPTVAGFYWSLVSGWRRSPPAANTEARFVSESPFASAIALMDTREATPDQIDNEEVKLVTLLNEHHDKLRDIYGADLPMEANPEILAEAEGSTARTNVIGVSEDGNVSQVSVLNYLSGLGLAWLYERRRRDVHNPVTTNDFPIAPTAAQFDALPLPSLKGFVINRLPHVRNAIGSIPAVRDNDDLDLFSGRVRTQRRAELMPNLPAPPTNPIPAVGQTITVRESDGDVFTGIELRFGDEYEISATGQIRGFAAAGLSGPDGWAPEELVNDAGWPLHTGLDPAARKFALLGRLGGYFVVGANLPRNRIFPPTPLPLFLRINDDVPGDGAGEFQVTIRIWGEPRAVYNPGRNITCVTKDQEDRISGIGGVRPDGTRWFLPLEQAIRFAINGHEFQVGNAKVKVRRTAENQFYLRTVNDGTEANNLSSLPLCP